MSRSEVTQIWGNMGGDEWRCPQCAPVISSGGNSHDQLHLGPVWKPLHSCAFYRQNLSSHLKSPTGSRKHQISKLPPKKQTEGSAGWPRRGLFSAADSSTLDAMVRIWNTKWAEGGIVFRVPPEKQVTTYSWNNWQQRAACGNLLPNVFAQQVGPKLSQAANGHRPAGVEWVITGLH